MQKLLLFAADSGDYTELPFLAEVARSSPESFPAVWETAIQDYARGSGLQESDIRLWSEWGKSLGRLDMQSQIDTFHLYKERLEVQLGEARKTAAEKGKLYLSLGLIGGLAAALLLA